MWDASRHRSEIRILAVDGGGIRGVIPAYWLRRLDAQIERHSQCANVSQCFDWFAGTSTGAIIAAALAVGISTEKLLALYESQGREIFPAFWGRRFFNPARYWGWLAAKYADDGLNKVLHEAFGNRTLGEVNNCGARRLLIVAFNAAAKQTVVFDSENPEHATIPVWKACRASAAAPTYFADYPIPLSNDLNEPYLDGGLSANNPAVCALGRALSLRLSNDSVFLVSLGTGSSLGEGYSAHRQSFRHMHGLLPWAPTIVQTVMNAGSGVFEDIASDVLAISQNYFRFECPLNLSSSALDDASEMNISSLMSDAKSYWESPIVAKQVQSLSGLLDGKELPDLREMEGVWESGFTEEYFESPSGRYKDSGVDTEDDQWPQTVIIQVRFRAFVAGESLPDDFSAGRFEACMVGGVLVGQWLSLRRNRASSFALTRMDRDCWCGPWIGGVDDEGRPARGIWTLKRKGVVSEGCCDR